MTLQFYLGRAGSGKTWRCLEDIAERLRVDPTPRGCPLIWLLPEQATAQAERALLRHPGIKGFARAHVVSFRRLAHMVLSDSGGAASPLLDENGRRMLLRSVLARHGERLQVFRRSFRENGFIARLAATFRELAEFRLSFDDLEAQARLIETEASGRSLLAMKLHDLALVGRAYEAEMASRFANPDHFLDLLARRVEQGALFEGAEVWVDAFASFMPQERRVLGSIMRRASAVRIALLLEPAAAGLQPSDTCLFSETEETYFRLSAMAAEDSVELLPSVPFPQPGRPTRFSDMPALQRLEAGLVGSELIGVKSRQQDGISAEAAAPVGFIPSPMPPLICVEAANRREEVEAVARAIRRLCREEGERFRNIAVITRDLEPYHALIRSIFAEHGIPYFIDLRRSVTHHPLVELLRSAIRIACEDWGLEDVVHYLKTDLAPLERHEADAIENYALAHGVRGRRWWAERSWSSAKEDGKGDKEHPLDAARARAFAPLLALVRALESEPMTAGRFVEALTVFLGALGAAETISTWATQDRDAGNLALAEEHEQVWQAVMDLLEQMRLALGDEPARLDDLASVLETGLSGLTLGLVPPALDQVLVGAVARSRQPGLWTAFVLGMNDDLFPKANSQDQILSDSERTSLIEHGLELSPPSVVRQFRERYLLYVALTRASRRLWISWAAATEEGSVLRPSPFLPVIEECAGTGKDAFFHVRLASDWLHNSVDAIELPSHAIEGSVRAAADGGNAAWAAVGAKLETVPHLADRFHAAMRSVSARNDAQVDSVAAGSLFDVRSAVSVSRLESFAKCPFAYFSNYVLGLKEREEFQIQPLQIGEFHHGILSEVFRILRGRVGRARPDWVPAPLGDRVLDWGTVTPAQAEEALDEAIELHREEFLADGPLHDSQTRFFVLRSRRLLLSALNAFILQGVQDDFVQVSSELDFGFASSSSPALRIPLANGKEISLRGKIDRIDLASENGCGPVARIFDFKSSEHKLALVDVLNGLSLQLPIYMAALLQNGGEGLKPGAILFLPVAHEVRASDAPGEANDGPPVVRARGAVDEESIPLFGPLEPGAQSPFIAVKLLKSGSWGSLDQGDWLPSGALARLCRRASAEAANLSARILSCCIDIRPYCRGAEKPCGYCEFGDLCRIAPQHADYRVIRSMKRSEAVGILGEGSDSVPES